MVRTHIFLILSVVSLLVLDSCRKRDSPSPQNGEFTIAGETYQLQVFSQRLFGFETSRLSFYSKPYPEGRGVEDLHTVEIEVMITNDDLIGTYSLPDGDSGKGIVNAYAWTHLTISELGFIRGSRYEFEQGELSISKNEEDYVVKMKFSNTLGEELTGWYEGPVQQ